ncbi:sulfatase-like hydrolase/transferase [Halomicroarcula sp. GCM10025324]|uniref:sulfatase-like hydrolase/transferase n=1 Tax=Haloarcula TaxID=2237 RepID=UPI0023E862DB|nr:sulfatase-like hydrolase/transferase [Halomicroarcula sp. ZS-22-S1]
MSSIENVLLILSDEHRPDALGCAGHPHVETPNLDALAAEGTRFTDAYCSSPLCVPSRASFATGRYVHEIGAWDNAAPYDGAPSSWGHHLTEHGVQHATVGKLHFEPDVDDGFDDQYLTEHMETLDTFGLYRDPPGVRPNGRNRIERAGPVPDGQAWYNTNGANEVCDQNRFERAVEWIEDRSKSEEPWLLSVNSLIPHFPLEVEQSYYDRYPPEEMDLPVDYPPSDDHPVLNQLREHFDGLDLRKETLRRTRSAYFGLITALDDYIGDLLDALERTGQADETLVVYTSDHGEVLGDHGLWWKCNMYEQSVGVPLVMRGPGIERGQTVEGPVSLLDVVPTMTDALDVPADPAWQGRSLLPIATGRGEQDPSRTVFSEYHAHGTSHGIYMIRRGSHKYVHYVDGPDQLFDLETDPDELTNRAGAPKYQDIGTSLKAELREIVDPEAVDERARRNQRRRRNELGIDGPSNVDPR